MIFPLLLLVIFIGGGFGIGYVIIKAISQPSEERGKKKLQELRSNTSYEPEEKSNELLQDFSSGTPDIRKILGEMRFIAEVTFDMYDEYNINKANSKKSIIYGFSNFRRQDELALAMNRNVKEEWEPRFKLLKEIQNSFNKDNDLYAAFMECGKIDNYMRKLTLLNINIANFSEYLGNTAKIALKGTAIMTISTVAVGGAMLHMANNAGKDMFTGGGHRYNPYTGEKLP